MDEARLREMIADWRQAATLHAAEWARKRDLERLYEAGMNFGQADALTIAARRLEELLKQSKGDE